VDGRTPPGDCHHEPAAATEVAIDPVFQGAYSVHQLDSIPGLQARKYAGMTLKAGDANTLLIGQDGSEASGALFSVPLLRSCGRIVGWGGPATRVASAPNIDGSIAYAP
jgi:hypothetical protein